MSSHRYLSLVGLLACGVAIAPAAGQAGNGRIVTAPTPRSTDAPGNAQTFRQQFNAANTTHDGHLTLQQAQAGHLPQIAKNFDAIDTNHNGYVTAEDIRKFREQRQTAQSRAAMANKP
jgi:hypothetical protein